MCGIFGVFSKNSITDRHKESIKKISSEILHRGPDGEGIFVDQNCILSMRRLSIIDLEGGWQPFLDESRNLALVVNGEIYNHVELRDELMSKGYVFKTRSDCETILYLYIEYGFDCLEYLRGMFSFALWDGDNQHLFIARDRLGEKPLYLAEVGDDLYFSSELRPLVKSGIVPFKLNPDTINLYFHYRYIPEPDTALEGVRKLPAGNYLIVDKKSGSISQHNYWDFQNIDAVEGNPAELIREKLLEVSDIILRSDVPVGIALSGGLDSSALACLASRRQSNIHAFSLGYDCDHHSDERSNAKELASYLGLPFHEIELSSSDFVDMFPDMVFARDDPIMDISGCGYQAISMRAKEEGVPVLLQGHGGDELFWGYNWVREAAEYSEIKESLFDKGGKLPWYRYMPFEMPKSLAVADLLRWVVGWCGVKHGMQKVKKIHESYQKNRNQYIFYDLVPHYIQAQNNISSLYTKEFSLKLSEEHSPNSVFSRNDHDSIDIAITDLIFKTYLCENGVAQGDRLSMASSVELRLPLLDYKLVETVIGLRKNKSDRDLGAKYWFKEAVKDIVPDWVMNRPKSGFQPPVRRWTEALFKEYGHLIKNGYLVSEGIIKPEVQGILSRGPYTSLGFAKSGASHLAFETLVLEIWCRKYLGMDLN